MTGKALRTHQFVLATDLDGTFLGGSDAQRKALYTWIEDRRDTVGLVFVTGRDPEFIVQLTRGTWVPTPDYVVGDVGTTIAFVGEDGHPEPIGELEKEIAETWGDAGPEVRQALEGRAGLTLQPTNFRYRVSYDLAPAELETGTQDLIEEMGHDVLISDNRYFDVLPRGISKGPSLRRLVAHLQLDENRVLAAGDTMNDLSMLECGLPAVAVGNSEAALLARLPQAPHIHRARAPGAAGIAEAIAAFGLHDDAKELTAAVTS